MVEILWHRWKTSRQTEKTKLVEVNGREQSTPHMFDFLGFTHYMGTNRKGKRILKRKTSKKKLKASLQRVNEWMKANRGKPVDQLIHEVNRKLRATTVTMGLRSIIRDSIFTITK